LRLGVEIQLLLSHSPSSDTQVLLSISEGSLQFAFMTRLDNRPLFDNFNFPGIMVPL
jgi:hypothetical protein